jgi:hypothetical protein
MVRAFPSPLFRAVFFLHITPGVPLALHSWLYSAAPSGCFDEMSLHDHPPFFSTWRKAYWFAVVLFAVEVALLYAFTLRFS